MLAYHLGAEVECKIAEAISPRHYQDGFHSTGTAAHSLGSSLRETISIRSFEDTQYLRLAASQSGGLRENFGTMTKPFQAGMLLRAACFRLNLSH